MPIREPNEMDRDPSSVVEDMMAIPEYAALFYEAYPDQGEPGTPENLARALADFQRTMISDGAQYDQYVAGDAGAMDDASLRGMFLFADAGCADCHVAPLFESERYVDRHLDRRDDDLGRFEVTEDEAEMYAYRVPALRNLRESEPYFHDGSAMTIEEAVRHEVDEQVAAGLSRHLDDEEILALVTFLDKALIDRSHEPDRPEEVPSGLTVPVDGFRIPR
jgi:cytochrome c peroxidase